MSANPTSGASAPGGAEGIKSVGSAQLPQDEDEEAGRDDDVVVNFHRSGNAQQV